MTPKIEWYQEILEQEPSSRVFFPLAKLLFEAGEMDQALTTLKYGLEHHPEFLEARLFLIHLLYHVGDMEGCSAEGVVIADLFNQYPDFWVAWGQAGTQAGGEFGLYMGLMSTLVANPNLTLWEFLSQGLKGVSQKNISVLGTHAAGKQQNMASQGTSSRPFSDTMQKMQQSTVSGNIAEADIGGSHTYIENVFSPNDTCTLRTRSMAEILAEQGDIEGAIQIYKELEAQATTKEEQAALHERQIFLSEQCTQNRDIVVSDKIFDPTYGINLQNEVINILEALVARLERRAKS